VSVVGLLAQTGNAPILSNGVASSISPRVEHAPNGRIRVYLPANWRNAAAADGRGTARQPLATFEFSTQAADMSLLAAALWFGVCHLEERRRRA
jgi:hypothetical protein